MSMNLVFKNKETNDFVEFPYQTSTNFTYRVLALNSKEKQFKAIEEDLNDIFDVNDNIENELLEDRLEDIKSYLFDNKYSLTMI